MELTVHEYAAYGVLVTMEDTVNGQPTLPLSFALEMADQLSEHDDTSD